MKRINWKAALAMIAAILATYIAIREGRVDDAATQAGAALDAAEDIVVDEPAPAPEPAPLQGPDLPAEAEAPAP